MGIDDEVETAPAGPTGKALGVVDQPPPCDHQDAVVVSVRPPLLAAHAPPAPQPHRSFAAGSVDSGREQDLRVDGRRVSVGAADAPWA
jgi:hypothetical protein